MFASSRLASNLRPSLAFQNYHLIQRCRGKLLPSMELFHQSYSTKPTMYTVKERTKKDGLLAKVKRKLSFFSIEDLRLKVKGRLLYEKLADSITYDVFFKEFEMQDSYFSWFLIMELHIWMMMLRTMADQNIGKIIRHEILEAMWIDVETRISKLGPIKRSKKNEELSTLSEQFNAAMIGYDEGINGDDKVLAGALWRRFFQCESNNPEHLEKLLAYVRKQVSILDNEPLMKLLDSKEITWISLKSC